ncbi:MAG: hypothetical protein HQM08_05940 [Candidatus Riflebacteria bacterium]|nr:hypothetical protein [Candidatus Riflebacteria bacterium]
MIIRFSKKNLRNFAIAFFLFLICLGVISIVFFYKTLFSPPKTRLKLDKFYPEIPPDSRYHYIVLPIDHNHPERGQFKSFYIFSPSYKVGSCPIFVLTDGQMNLVGMKPDFDFFEGRLKGQSYVLFSTRGQFPTSFPEVYNENGSLKIEEAVKLLDSDQQIEDIEAVRCQMLKEGKLPKDGKIMIFGASGAGILAQQYIEKYGKYVSRAFLEVTGAPDISVKSGANYSRDLNDFSPELQELFAKAIQSGKYDPAYLSYLFYQISRNSKSSISDQVSFFKKILDGSSWEYYSWLIKPSYNLGLVQAFFSIPSGASGKVRWFELVGNDLKQSPEPAKKADNLMNIFSHALFTDFLEKEKLGQIKIKTFNFNRENYEGETFILAGERDIVFSPKIAQAMFKLYKKCKLILLDDGHRMVNHTDYLIQLRTAFFNYGLDSKEFLEICEKNKKS